MRRRAGLAELAGIAGLALLVSLPACSPATRRPAFAPMPEARRGELELEVPAATDSLAKVLIAAGIPVSRIASRDGYLETPWFDTATGRPAAGRPLGPGRVRVRAWVSPSRYRYSELAVETVFRPFADPSAAPRDLEQSVAYSHPVRQRVRTVLTSLGARALAEEPDALTLAERRARDAAERKAAEQRYAAANKGIMAEPGEADTSVAAGDTALAAGDSIVADTLAIRRTPAARDTTPRRADSAAVAARPADSAAVAARPAEARPQVIAPAPAPAAQTPVAPAQTPAAIFSVQVAASADRSVVDLAATRLRDLGYTPRIVTENGLMKVRTARYATESAARAVQRRLRTTFPDAFMTRR